MSQYPQGSPSQPPQYQGAYPPPPGYGAPQGPGGFGPTPPGNGAAVASLVFGLLLCIPLITGLIAIVLGLKGRGRANQIGGNGRGLATAGLTLGIIGVLGWAAATPLVYQAYQSAKANKELASQFVQAMGDGDIDKAASLSHSTMARKDLAGPSEKIRTLGKLKDVTVSGIEVKTSTSLGKQWAVSGKATFEQRVMDFSVFLVDEKGSPKVVEYSFR